MHGCSRAALLAALTPCMWSHLACWEPYLKRACTRERKNKKGKEAMKETTPKELTDEVDEKGLTWSPWTFQRKHTMVLPARSRWNILFYKAVLQHGCFLLVRITGILKAPFLKKWQRCTNGLREGGEVLSHLLRATPGPFPGCGVRVVREWCCYSAFDGIIPWAHAFASLILLWFS